MNDSSSKSLKDISKRLLILFFLASISMLVPIYSKTNSVELLVWHLYKSSDTDTSNTEDSCSFHSASALIQIRAWMTLYKQRSWIGRVPAAPLFEHSGWKACFSPLWSAWCPLLNWSADSSRVDRGDNSHGSYGAGWYCAESKSCSMGLILTPKTNS